MKYVLAIILGFMGMSQFAHANLLVSPTRVAFEGKDRVKDIILINVTDKARSYRVEWQENTTDESGTYSIIPDSKVSFAASSFIRYSPRQVMLQPGERQVIKLMLRRKSNMNLAEYRSHLKVTALPSQLITAKGETTEQSNVGFKIDVLTSYTLPVIVRTQPVDAKIKIGSVSVKANEDGIISFDLDIHKKGKSSVSGDIQIFLLDENSNETRVGILRGVNIFHESNRRLINMRWHDYKGPVKGKLRVEYLGDAEFAGQELASYQGEVNLDDFN